MFRKALFFEMKEIYEASRAKILMDWYITKRLVFVRNIAHLIRCEN